MSQKVHEIARDLLASSKEIMDLVRSLGVEVKNHMATVEDDIAEKVKVEYAKKREEQKAKAPAPRLQVRVPSALHTPLIPLREEQGAAAEKAEIPAEATKKATRTRTAAKKAEKPVEGEPATAAKPKASGERATTRRSAANKTGVAKAPTGQTAAREAAADETPAKDAAAKDATARERSAATRRPAAQDMPATADENRPQVEDAPKKQAAPAPATPANATPANATPANATPAAPAATPARPAAPPPARPTGPQGIQSSPRPAGSGVSSLPRPAGAGPTPRPAGYQGVSSGPRPVGSGPRPAGAQGGPRPPYPGQGPRPGFAGPVGGPRPAGAGGFGAPRPGGPRPGGPRPAGGPMRPGAGPAGAPAAGPVPVGRPGAAKGGQRRGGQDFRSRKREIEERERERRALQEARAREQAAQPKERKPLSITEDLTVKELADKMDMRSSEVIRKLIAMGVMATVNQTLDAETAKIVATELGFPIKEEAPVVEEVLDPIDDDDEPDELKESRPPVVTVMGHVDHGKTSLLDAIRKTNVTAREAGGITQHIGASTVEIKGRKIVFLDTPGHEAFTSMRARGAKVTDIAILVVAADDSVMPQTVEAINHAKAAEVPIIVAINKMDTRGADPQRVKTDLTQHGLVVEEWGGDTIAVPVSAKDGTGIDQLLEMVLLVADVHELKANPNKPARGSIIEAEIDKGRGPVATVLIRSGTLHVGDPVVAGLTYGKVRAMFDDKGRKIKKAGPSMPVEVLGLADVPQAGDMFFAVESEQRAREIAEKKQVRKRTEDMTVKQRVTLDDLMNQIKQGEVKDLNIVLKGDVQGSVEAVKAAIEKLSTSEIRIQVIHAAVGAINESDVLLASTSKAIIVGFNVRPDANARRLSERDQIDIRTYSIIYEVVDDIKRAMEGMLEPEEREVVSGHVEVRQLFKVPKFGTIAGSYVSEGKVIRGYTARVIRDGIVVHTAKIDSLRRLKDDVHEVVAGYECGIHLENYNDLKEGDVIEAFTIEKVKREL